MPATPFPKDFNNVKMPVFTPTRVQAVVDATPWTPGADDRAFYATEDFTAVVITHPVLGAQTAVSLLANIPWGIVPGATYTFTTNTVDLIVVQ